jgi:uncharacterized protein (DUF2147 family)
MFTKSTRTIALLPILLAANAGAAAAGPSPLGTWIDHTGRGAVEITDCNGALCGHVVWLKNSADGEACNMQILGNVKPVAGGKWDKGWIYDPERRSKFDVEITPIGEQKLKVMGYAGMKLFSETVTWTRAPADLKRCGKASQEAKANVEPKADASAPALASAEPPAAKTAAAEPVREVAASPAAPEKETAAAVPVSKGGQARAKGKQCTISVRELGKFSFPC